jgi:hypothetical protein
VVLLCAREVGPIAEGGGCESSIVEASSVVEGLDLSVELSVGLGKVGGIGQCGLKRVCCVLGAEGDGSLSGNEEACVSGL